MILYDSTRSYVWSYHFYNPNVILNVLVRWIHKIMWCYDPDRNFDNYVYVCIYIYISEYHVSFSTWDALVHNFLNKYIYIYIYIYIYKNDWKIVQILDGRQWLWRRWEAPLTAIGVGASKSWAMAGLERRRKHRNPDEREKSETRRRPRRQASSVGGSGVGFDGC